MRHLHIHTDCEYFAGCERLLPHFWNSNKVNDVFRISFTYRKSKRYQMELRPFLPNTIRATPIFKSFHIKQISLRSGQSNTSLVHGLLQLADKIFAVIFLYPLFVLELSKLTLVFLKDRPDVLQINNGGYPGARSARAAACAGKICRVPIILMVVNNMAVSKKNLSRFLDSPIDILVRRSVNLFITASNQANKALVSALGLELGKTHVIPNAVAPTIIPESRLSIRESVLSDSSTIVIGMVAVLEKRKGHQVFLDALSILKNENPLLTKCLKVWIVGDGPLASSLKDAAQNLGLAEIIQFFGYRYDYLRLISAMDIAVLSSISDEDSPLFTIEAMSLGIPIIVSDFAGLSDQVVNRENGILFPVGDSRALAESLIELIKDQKLRVSMGQTAEASYQSRYSVDQFIWNYMNLYQKIDYQISRLDDNWL